MLNLSIILPEFLGSKIINIPIEDPLNFKIDDLLKDLSLGEGVDFSLYSFKYNDKLLLPTNFNQFDLPSMVEALLILESPLIDEALEIIRRKMITDANIRNIISQKEPEIFQAALNDPLKFQFLFKSKHISNNNPSTTSTTTAITATNSLNPNSFNKRRITQTKEEKIEENLMMAMEYHPEVFGSITMLYVSCRINETTIKAFVDCGAQTTIISKSCALRCGLEDLIDVRFAAIAHGVGSGKILGRIHSVQLKLGSLFLPCSLTVLDNDSSSSLSNASLPDVLLGLDMLKRYQISIDLFDNDLKIKGESIVSFLPESEIPKAEAAAEAEEAAMNE